MSDLKGMENFINSLPKPLLVLLVLGGAIAFFITSSPMHTVCDTQLEVLREAQKGNVFPSVVTVKGTKQRIPPAITKFKESCQVGNSAGACYQYFTSLRSIAVDIGKASSECTPMMFEVEELKRAMTDGIEVMARIAWGAKPPDEGFARFNWLQDSEVAVFCRLKNIYVRAVDEEGWEVLRRSIYKKLPGEVVSPQSDPGQPAIEPKSASVMMTEQDIWNRSLFSVRCESYL